MKRRIAWVSGLSQDGSWSQPGRKLDKWAARNSIWNFVGQFQMTLPRLYGRYPACPCGGNRRAGWHPGHLGIKDAFEMASVFIRRVLGRDPMSGERLNRSRPLLGLSAGNDALEIVHVGSEIQSKPVADDRAVQLDPDRRDLLAPCPHASKPWGAGRRRYAELGQVVDQRLL